jgi:hypothetical protein
MVSLGNRDDNLEFDHGDGGNSNPASHGFVSTKEQQTQRGVRTTVTSNSRAPRAVSPNYAGQIGRHAGGGLMK